MRSLFEKPTVAELAEVIEQQRQDHRLAMPPLRAVSRSDQSLLSFAQQRLWFMDQLEPGSAAYNISAGMWLKGSLQVEALEQTLSEIARRHEVLRTNFVTSEGRARQIIQSETTIMLPVVDLSELPEAEQEGEARKLAVAEAQRPFDLAHDRLWRACLFKLAPERHLGLFTMHHIVSDGWSLEILIREVATLYEAYAGGRVSPLPELPFQYADFAMWQRDWLQGELLETQLGYWRRQLAGITELELPTDRPRPTGAKRSLHGMKHRFEWSRQLSEALKRLSQREGLTLFMTTLTCFKILLRYLSNQDDIVVGTDVANRNHKELEGLIGFFVNQLVLRTNFVGAQSFRDLARRVREGALQAYAHQDVPFEQLVATLKPGRQKHAMTLFQVKFMVQNASPSDLELTGLTLYPLRIDNDLMDMDLIISLTDTAAGLRGWINGDPNLFEATTLTRYALLFEALVQRVVSDPELSLAALTEGLGETDRQAQVTMKARREEHKLRRFREIKPGMIDLKFENDQVRVDQEQRRPENRE
jgi:hypothetical protein